MLRWSFLLGFYYLINICIRIKIPTQKSFMCFGFVMWRCTSLRMQNYFSLIYISPWYVFNIKFLLLLKLWLLFFYILIFVHYLFEFWIHNYVLHLFGLICWKKQGCTGCHQCLEFRLCYFWSFWSVCRILVWKFLLLKLYPIILLNNIDLSNNF